MVTLIYPDPLYMWKVFIIGVILVEKKNGLSFMNMAIIYLCPNAWNTSFVILPLELSLIIHLAKESKYVDIHDCYDALKTF
jgi:hypothetical protein